MTENEETYSYKGWLNSDSFLKRVLAIMGYGAIGQILLMAALFGGGIIVGGVAALFGE